MNTEIPPMLLVSYRIPHASRALKTLTPLMRHGFNIVTSKGTMAIDGDDAEALSAHLAHRLRARVDKKPSQRKSSNSSEDDIHTGYRSGWSASAIPGYQGSPPIETEVLASVLDAMQTAKEIAGPVSDQYIDLMDAIAADAQQRSATARKERGTRTTKAILMIRSWALAIIK